MKGYKHIGLWLHHIESFSTLDGPGVRTVFFLQGCPLRCQYCHNRDSWEPNQGNFYTFDALMTIVLSNTPYFGKRGGVTFSGGEPLLQSEALLTLINALKSHRIHVTLDTSGAVTHSKAFEVLKRCDLVILDVKHTQPEAYAQLTGGQLEAPLKTFAFLDECAKPFWIRQVLMDTINANEQQVRRLIRITKSASREKIELLKYHRYGEHKWGAGHEPSFAPPDDAVFERLCRLTLELD